MKNPRTIALITLSAVVLILLFQNLQTAVVHLFFWDISMPLIILIFVSLLAGFVSGYLFSVIQSGRSGRGGSDGGE